MVLFFYFFYFRWGKIDKFSIFKANNIGVGRNAEST